jgi:DNA-binding CsgD family transcriptional regulator
LTVDAGLRRGRPGGERELAERVGFSLNPHNHLKNHDFFKVGCNGCDRLM